MPRKKLPQTPGQTSPNLGEEETSGRMRERKDRVLQARVPLSLYRALVAQARQLRVPVSNIVRNILEDSTRMVEHIVDGSIEIAETLGRSPKEKDLSSVLGWQSMIANRALVCSRCGQTIQKGSAAFLSVGAPGGRTFVICEGCKCGT